MRNKEFKKVMNVLVRYPSFDYIKNKNNYEIVNQNIQRKVKETDSTRVQYNIKYSHDRILITIVYFKEIEYDINVVLTEKVFNKYKRISEIKKLL